MQWREVDGYDWCVIETPESGPYLSLTLGYGLVHEPIDQYGTLQLAAGMLQAELSRPVEMGFGRASVPEISVNVGTDITSVGMRGDVATLRAAWQRLAEVFRRSASAGCGTARGRKRFSSTPRPDVSVRTLLVDVCGIPNT